VASLRLLAFALAAIAARGAEDVSVAGEWRIRRSAAGAQSTQTCTLTRAGEEIGGSCSADRGPVKVTGKVEGRKVTWTYQTERDGGPLTVIYRGVIESPDTIKGSVSAVEYGIDGEFTATRVK
jgi:hypothetical protein